MANLPEEQTYDAGVYQIELTDPVIGGPGGTSNKPLRNLANRTKWLKSQVDAMPGEMDARVAAHNAQTDPHPQYETSAEAAAKITAHKAEADPHPQYNVPAWAKQASKPSYTKQDVGLGNVDNTSDSSKSVNHSETAAKLHTDSWSVYEEMGSLFFAHGGVKKAKLDSSGNITVVGDITAFGSF